jgi:hypothetical protein
MGAAAASGITSDGEADASGARTVKAAAGERPEAASRSAGGICAGDGCDAGSLKFTTAAARPIPAATRNNRNVKRKRVRIGRP